MGLEEEVKGGGRRWEIQFRNFQRGDFSEHEVGKGERRGGLEDVKGVEDCQRMQNEWKAGVRGKCQWTWVSIDSEHTK